MDFTELQSLHLFMSKLSDLCSLFFVLRSLQQCPSSALQPMYEKKRKEQVRGNKKEERKIEKKKLIEKKVEKIKQTNNKEEWPRSLIKKSKQGLNSTCNYMQNAQLRFDLGLGHIMYAVATV